MSWGAVIVGGASLVSGYMSSKSQSDAADKASNAAQQTSSASNELQRYLYDKNRSDMQPFRDIELQGAQVGIENLNRMNSIVAPGFKQSEAYNFNLGQGINALDRSAVASGRSRNSDTMQFAQGLASNEYNNYLNRIQNLGSVGTGYANAMAGAGQGYANAVNSNNQYAGDAAQQAALASGQANAQLWNTIGTAPMNAMSMYNMYQQPTTTQTSPNYGYQWQPGPSGTTSANAMMNYGGR